MPHQRVFFDLFLEVFPILSHKRGLKKANEFALLSPEFIAYRENTKLFFALYIVLMGAY
jgi:hypothetical protein